MQRFLKVLEQQGCREKLARMHGAPGGCRDVLLLRHYNEPPSNAVVLAARDLAADTHLDSSLGIYIRDAAQGPPHLSADTYLKQSIERANVRVQLHEDDGLWISRLMTTRTIQQGSQLCIHQGLGPWLLWQWRDEKKKKEPDWQALATEAEKDLLDAMKIYALYKDIA